MRNKHTVSSWVEGGFSEARDWADNVGVSQHDTPKAQRRETERSKRLLVGHFGGF